jgi:hypothetical protein
VHAAVAHVNAIDDGITQRPAGLHDPPAHRIGYSGLARELKDSNRCG